MLDVLVITPQRVIFEGKARSVTVPGEQGVFEILSYHKDIVSRLFSGDVKVDEKKYKVKRGIARVENDNVTIIVER